MSNVGSFSFTGWNYDVQVQSGFRAIYRLNNAATFKVRPSRTNMMVIADILTLNA